jgi:hypothetical protein
MHWYRCRFKVFSLFQISHSKMTYQSYITVYFPKDKTFVALRQNEKCVKYLDFPDVLVKYPTGLWRGRIIGQSGVRQFYTYYWKKSSQLTILTTMGSKNLSRETDQNFKSLKNLSIFEFKLWLFFLIKSGLFMFSVGKTCIEIAITKIRLPGNRVLGNIF